MNLKEFREATNELDEKLQIVTTDGESFFDVVDVDHNTLQVEITPSSIEKDYA